MTRTLIVGDLHAADKTPVGRVDNYLSSFLDKMGQVVDIAKTSNVDSIVFLGDIFHKKRPNHVSHFLVNLLQRLFSELPVEPIVLVGNHDIPLKTKGVDWYPVGSLTGVHLVDSCDCFVVGDFFYMFYPGHIDYSEELLLEFISSCSIPKDKVSVLFVHNSISEVHLPFYYVKPQSLRFLDVDFVVFGHIHSRYGPKKVGKPVFFNPGALMRVSRSAADLALQPAVAVLDSSGDGLNAFTVLDLVVEESYSVFDMDSLDAEKVLLQERSRFIENLDTINFDGLSFEGLVGQIRSASISDELKTLIISTLESVYG